MAVAVARASSPAINSRAFPSALTTSLRRGSVTPGLETRRPRSVRRLQALPLGDTVPSQSCIVLRGNAVCLR